MRARLAWTAVVLLSACTGADGIGDAELAFEVTSGALVEGAQVPVEHTCDGADEPPDLAWTDVPEEAAQVLVVVDDPGAPDGPFTHWIVWGLDPGAPPLTTPLPAGAIEGTNDCGDVGYGGPCPPEGDQAHTYRFRVIALAQPVRLSEAATVDEVAGAVEEVLGEGRLTATYGR
jgi:Raf kinase inhibitor-like YbhB/YbcL family protein